MIFLNNFAFFLGQILKSFLWNMSRIFNEDVRTCLHQYMKMGTLKLSFLSLLKLHHFQSFFLNSFHFLVYDYHLFSKSQRNYQKNQRISFVFENKINVVWNANRLKWIKQNNRLRIVITMVLLGRDVLEYRKDSKNHE